MMMKKKFVAVALSAVCLLSAVGCGQQSASTASSASSVSSSVASSASASQVMDAEDYLSGISGTYVELFPELSKEEYRDIWIDAVTPLAGEENAETTTDMLLGMCMAEVYGPEAAEKYEADPGSMAFDCYFLGGVDKFVMDGDTITGLDEQGQEVFSHTYKQLEEENENDFIFYDSDTLSDWVKLDVATGEETTDQILYNTQTGEQYTGFLQVYPGGLASFSTSDGRYELRDMTTEDRGLISTFDEQPSQYFPGYVVTWHSGEGHGYELYDLETGAKTPLYDVDATDNTVAVYALDGSLRVYSKDNGKLLTDTTVEPVEHQQRVRMSNCGTGYVWLELQDNDRYETTATRLYGPQGLVSDLTALQGKYSYVNYLTTDPDGRPMFYGSRAAAGSAYGSVCDVLNADGKVVLQGLSSCTGYYSNSLNALPDHVFAAQRGFYVGWMDTSGNWLYCQSIFSSATADDVPSYGY